MIATFLSIVSFVIIVCLAYFCMRLHSSRNALQRKLSVVESNVLAYGEANASLLWRLAAVEAAQLEKLTLDQIEYRDQIEAQLKAQYAALFKQIEDNMKADLKRARAETSDLVSTSIANTGLLRAEFDKKLKAEFETACEAIKFNEIEYKKTITKKRKEFNRKNGMNAKPQRVWRYIDEE